MRTEVVSQLEPHMRLFVALTTLLGLALPAGAQNNGLMQHSQNGDSAGPTSPPPVVQPTAPGEIVLDDAVVQARPAAQIVAANTANPVLLQHSLIAVEPPQPQEIRVNDLVTIIIREDKRSQTDSRLQSDKKWDLTGELAKWLRLDGEHNMIPQNFTQGTPGVDLTVDSKYSGQGRVDRRDTLILRITATVIDVKPNGNLALEAKKTIKTDDETQVITLTGVCRSADVTPQNTVLSTQIADAEIMVEHTGAARDASRRGWLMKMFDFLRPI